MADLDSLGDLFVLAFVAVSALLVGLTFVERWLTTSTAQPPESPPRESDPPSQADVDGHS